MDFWEQLLDSVPESTFLEHNACPACKTDLELVTESNSDQVITRLGHTFLKRCLSCNLTYSSPRLSSVIRDGMYRLNPGAMTEALNDILEPLMAQRVAGMLREMFPAEGNGFNSFFEVGSGWGHFLAASAKYFKKVSGVEFSREQAAYSRSRFGLEISEEDIFLHNQGLNYDVIAAWELLEHLPNPRQFLNWAHSQLNSGGQLVLSTPNYGSLYRRTLGTHWFYFIPSQHLTYFSPQTLKALLQSVGFTEIKIFTSGRSLFRERWNSHNQIDLKLNEKQQWIQALRIREDIEQKRDTTVLDRRGVMMHVWHGMIWRLINPLVTRGLGDQMRVYARKA